MPTNPAAPLKAIPRINDIALEIDRKVPKITHNTTTTFTSILYSLYKNVSAPIRIDSAISDISVVPSLSRLTFQKLYAAYAVPIPDTPSTGNKISTLGPPFLCHSSNKLHWNTFDVYYPPSVSIAYFYYKIHYWTTIFYHISQFFSIDFL